MSVAYLDIPEVALEGAPFRARRRGMVLRGTCTLRLTFLLSPAAGLMRNAAGSYGPVIAVIVLMTGMTTILFYMVDRREPHGPIIAVRIPT